MVPSSSLIILPTGMPVQPEITSPTMEASTNGRTSGFSPCSVSSSATACVYSVRSASAAV